MMTRKVYIEFARRLKNITPDVVPESSYELGRRNGLREAIEIMTMVMREDNPRFDYDRFIEATGINRAYDPEKELTG